ncbi:hypothetical protein M422DRAFT_241479 [Sphaerobolus stellatus SS14]|nr:hypothetical protein M422DRAFT_241479 [Sphaerobolus stellatus SS14]
MNVVQPTVVVDDVDDQWSCYSHDSDAYESVYLSFCESLGRPQSPVQRNSDPDAIQDISTPSLHSISELDPLTVKDQRSYERARQRLKKPHDRSKAKGELNQGCRCHWCLRGKASWIASNLKEADRMLRHDFNEAKHIPHLEDSIHSPKDSKDRSLTSGPVHRTVTVSLADLVKPPKKGTDKRFEIVNRPRQVLALDDFTEIDPGMYDVDDWEYIELNQKRGKVVPQAPRLSYARVAATKA